MKIIRIDLRKIRDFIVGLEAIQARITQEKAKGTQGLAELERSIASNIRSANQTEEKIKQGSYPLNNGFYEIDAETSSEYQMLIQFENEVSRVAEGKFLGDLQKSMGTLKDLLLNG
tara:strand:- start:31 stop:378 length:348 start_codon:yes stop_codon:yes gene_type:complete